MCWQNYSPTEPKKQQTPTAKSETKKSCEFCYNFLEHGFMGVFVRFGVEIATKFNSPYVGFSKTAPYQETRSQCMRRAKCHMVHAVEWIVDTSDTQFWCSCVYIAMWPARCENCNIHVWYWIKFVSAQRHKMKRMPCIGCFHVSPVCFVNIKARSCKTAFMIIDLPIYFCKLCLIWFSHTWCPFGTRTLQTAWRSEKLVSFFLWVRLIFAHQFPATYFYEPGQCH